VRHQRLWGISPEGKDDMEENRNPKILIVDDRPENLLSMEIIFENEPCQIIKALSGSEALAKMLVHDFAVVLLDVQMPEIDGFETAELMRNSENIKHVPIIFVTAISKEKQHMFKGYKSGAVDYIFKPIEPEILKTKVFVFLKLYNQHKNLENINNRLKNAVEELEQANRKILEQQEELMEEERLKVLLEMAGATAHELNQPLMSLLASIELIEICQGDSKKMTKHLVRIKEAGQRIAEVSRKIDKIRHYDIKSHDTQTRIINLNQPLNILYVEDNQDDFNKVKNILSPTSDISLFHARTIQEGLHLIRQHDSLQIDLVFLDFVLDDGTGFDFMEQMKKDDFQIPIVIITGHDNEIVSAQLIQVGASYYLPKSQINYGALLRVIQQVMEKQRLKMDLQHMQARLVEISIKDVLTGLCSRRYFMETLTTELKRASRHKRDLSLCMIDIDHFKAINDNLGHQAGDDVLSSIASRISACLRQNDVAGRYGGEEFAVILPETGITGALLVGEKIRQMVAGTKFVNFNKNLKVTISVGVAAMSHGQGIHEIIEAADTALYRAKEKGRDRVESFT